MQPDLLKKKACDGLRHLLDAIAWTRIFEKMSCNPNNIQTEYKVIVQLTTFAKVVSHTEEHLSLHMILQKEIGIILFFLKNK